MFIAQACPVWWTIHIIGESDTINELKKIVRCLGLNNVMFYGTKTTDELNALYNNFDIGLGCLALHRRNADIDTTLNIIEYYCRGIPVVTSGISPLLDEKFTYRIVDNEDPIDIRQIYNFYRNLDINDLKHLSEIAREQFEWNNIFKNMLNKYEVQ